MTACILYLIIAGIVSLAFVLTEETCTYIASKVARYLFNRAFASTDSEES